MKFSLPQGKSLSEMRQNKLLPVIITLVVAIAAVPLLLKADPPPPPPPIDTTAGPDESNEAVPAVMVASEGVRDYRKRLDLLQAKNPFTDHFVVPAKVVREQAGIDEAPEGSVPDVGAPPVEEVVPPADEVVIEPVVPGDPGAGEEVVVEPAPEPEVIVEETQVQVRYSYRVDVEVGLAGQAQKREGVKQLSVLPSKSRPLVIFNGVTEDEKSAVFTVSSDVIGTSGGGSCVPSAVDCQILTMEPGAKREFTYVPEDGVASEYVLRLRGIDAVVVETIE